MEEESWSRISGRHLGGIWGAFGRHLGSIWEASTLGFPPGPSVVCLLFHACLMAPWLGFLFRCGLLVFRGIPSIRFGTLLATLGTAGAAFGYPGTAFWSPWHPFGIFWQAIGDIVHGRGALLVPRGAPLAPHGHPLGATLPLLGKSRQKGQKDHYV